MTWPAWCPRRWSPPMSRCGSGEEGSDRGGRPECGRRLWDCGAAGGDRRRDPEVPALRRRPADLPDAGLCDRDGSAAGPVRGAGAAGDPGTLAALAGGGGRLDAGRGGVVQSAAAAGFAARLKDAVDLDAVGDDLAAVVHQALEPAHVSVWVRGHE